MRLKKVDKTRRRMQRESKNGMRKYITESLASGYSFDQIRIALAEHGYGEKKSDAIICEYRDHLRAKGKLISNNLLAMFVVGFMIISVISNFYFISNLPQFTGLYSQNTTTLARVTMCVNSQPYFNISVCPVEVSVTDPYYCILNISDFDWNYTNITFTYYDNSTLFDIINLTNMTAEINFTTIYPDDLGGDTSLRKNYTVEVKVSDGSVCNNANFTQLLNFMVFKGCSVKSPPELDNVLDNYTLVRNTKYRESDWLFDINATEVDFEDSFNYSLQNVDYSAYTSLDIDGDYVDFNTVSGFLNISPHILHVGWHLLNLSVTDNSSCANDSSWKLVNITVDGNNSAPYYNGSLTDLDGSWQQGNKILWYVDLNEFFLDADGDCLKFELERQVISGDEHLDITIDNNEDPRVAYIPGKECPVHTVTVEVTAAYRGTGGAGWYGTEIWCFTANDTLNVSDPVCANYTVIKREINDEIHPDGSTVAEGGGGAAAAISRCEEKWYCDPWGDCIGGHMIRNCTDINECHTSKYKPNITQECVDIAHCYDNIQNFGESGIDCGGECSRECSTCFDAIMNCHILWNGTESCEGGVDCGGP